MSKNEAFKQVTLDPVGHAPLIFLQRTPDGKAYFKNDRDELKISDFEIGPTQLHVNTFIEYERTFGRGIAFDFTHAHRGRPLEGTPKANIAYAQRAGIEISDTDATEAMAIYNNLAERISDILVSEDRASLEATIRSCKEFRRRFPSLYPEFKPRKKFVIRP